MASNKYFSDAELSCPCCGENKFNPRTLDRLTEMRRVLDFPFVVTSGYRCRAYNEDKGYTQTHATGQAVDIAVSHKSAYRLVTAAQRFGFSGVGVAQKGAPGTRFIHLDDLMEIQHARPRPHIWSY